MNAARSASPTRAPRRAQAGFTLVEMMVAMAISLIVMLGFAATFVSMKQTFNTQNGLSLLQDNQRLASMILTNSLTEAGYFPTGADPTASPRVPPQVVDRTTAFNVATTDPVGGALVAGSYLFGVTADASAGKVESLSTAYVSAPGDGVLDCQGGTTTGSSSVVIRNVFYVQTINANTPTSTPALGCLVYRGSTVTAAWAPLITNVQSMSVLYGVDTDGDTNIDTYLQAKDMTAANWNNVKNVKITLNFVNPNANVDTAHATLPVVQVVNVMNNKQ